MPSAAKSAIYTRVSTLPSTITLPSLLMSRSTRICAVPVFCSVACLTEDGPSKVADSGRARAWNDTGFSDDDSTHSGFEVWGEAEAYLVEADCRVVWSMEGTACQGCNLAWDVELTALSEGVCPFERGTRGRFEVKNDAAYFDGDYWGAAEVDPYWGWSTPGFDYVAWETEGYVYGDSGHAYHYSGRAIGYWPPREW